MHDMLWPVFLLALTGAVFCPWMPASWAVGGGRFIATIIAWAFASHNPRSFVNRGCLFSLLYYFMGYADIERVTRVTVLDDQWLSRKLSRKKGNSRITVWTQTGFGKWRWVVWQSHVISGQLGGTPFRALVTTRNSASYQGHKICRLRTPVTPMPILTYLDYHYH